MRITRVKSKARNPNQRPETRRRVITQDRRVPLGKMELPTEKSEPVTDIMEFTGLMYGREKIGKTVVLASVKDVIFFATEPGTKGMEIFEFNREDGGVYDWDVFRRGVDLLEGQGSGNPFKTVAIDTADMAYEKCKDYVCKLLGIPAPGKDKDGVNDWGASWNAVRKEFTHQIHRLIQAGYGVWFTSHVKEEEINTRYGDSYTRIRPSMSGQARSVIEALVDFFFYAEYLRDKAGNSIRVLICEGDETIWAGARKTPGGKFPRFLPILEENGFQVIRDAFHGRTKGIDPMTLMAGKSTTDTGRRFFQKAKVRAAQEQKRT